MLFEFRNETEMNGRFRLLLCLEEKFIQGLGGNLRERDN